MRLLYLKPELKDLSQVAVLGESDKELLMILDNEKINAYGLTGNMGCGKSTVAEFFKKYNNVCVLNCDQISKEILFNIMILFICTY